MTYISKWRPIRTSQTASFPLISLLPAPFGRLEILTSLHSSLISRIKGDLWQDVRIEKSRLLLQMWRRKKTCLSAAAEAAAAAAAAAKYCLVKDLVSFWPAAQQD